MAYPELNTASERIEKCILDEEKQYWSVIDKGYELFEQMRLGMPSGSTIFSGEFCPFGKFLCYVDGSLS